MSQKPNYAVTASTLLQISMDHPRDSFVSIVTKDGSHEMMDLVHQVTMLTIKNEKLQEQMDSLAQALDRIEAIEDKMIGGDWDEIIEARAVARAALSLVKGEQK